MFITQMKYASFIVTPSDDEQQNTKHKIAEQDDKVQQMLLWSNLSAIWGYVLLTFVIIRVYGNFKGQHTLWLVGCLASMCMLLGVYLFTVWKSIAYKPGNGINNIDRAYLNDQISKLIGQRKLITGYLISNSLIIGAASLFFYLDIHNGITSIFKMTAPVSILTYVLGLWFIIKFTMQKRKLAILDQQVEQIMAVRQN